MEFLRGDYIHEKILVPGIILGREDLIFVENDLTAILFLTFLLKKGHEAGWTCVNALPTSSCLHRCRQ